MANQEQLAILKQGVDAWNKWRKENPNANIDISEAELRRINLRGCDLSGADLSKANLCEADLVIANLRGANLSRTDLVGVNLSGANLKGANLGKANLQKADLSETDLAEIDLRGANLRKAYLKLATIGYAIFANTNLAEVFSLETIRHFGPSTIGSDTFQHFQGTLPVTFLRGCGLPEWEIESAKLFNRSLSNEEINTIVYKIFDLRATQSIQISPLFISYSHADKDFVDHMDKFLTAKGVRFWRDIHDAKAGRLETQIDLAIRQNPTVLLVLSKNSFNSDWVEHEVRHARKLEKELGRDVLCPVALDDSWKSSPWPERVMEQITEYNILDFSGWQDKSNFDRQFAKLLSGLGIFYKKPEI